MGCEQSQVVTAAFRALGHEAYSCDFQPGEINAAWHIQDDVLKHLNDGWDLAIFHPPCDHLCSSGAAHFATKRADGRQQAAIDFFMALVAAPIPRIVIENPVGIMSRIYRKPDQLLQPYEYGHAETKKTCLWLKNLPQLKPTNIVEPDYMRNADGALKLDAAGKRYSRIHWMTGWMKSEDRKRLRSRTYDGIAAALAEQYSNIPKYWKWQKKNA